MRGLSHRLTSVRQGRSRYSTSLRESTNAAEAASAAMPVRCTGDTGDTTAEMGTKLLAPSGDREGELSGIGGSNRLCWLMALSAWRWTAGVSLRSMTNDRCGCLHYMEQLFSCQAMYTGRSGLGAVSPVGGGSTTTAERREGTVLAAALLSAARG